MYSFVSADWSKVPGKRSVYVSNFRERRIERAHPPGKQWTLQSLMTLAESLAQSAPVLVGVDVALGVPTGYWSLLGQRRRGTGGTFVDWLGGLDPGDGFFGTSSVPEEWCIDRPWFAVQEGPGGLKAFTRAVPGGMLRRIDAATHAKPLFAVSGIPGTVGSGTREFWKELAICLPAPRRFAVWPFEGDLPALFTNHRIVLSETYPRLAYAAALSRHLPANPIALPKTKYDARALACNCLSRVEWVSANNVCLGDLDPARANEDNFDALFTAAAVLRCQLEDRPLADRKWIDPVAEGSMLLAGPVCPGGKTRALALPGQPQANPGPGDRNAAAPPASGIVPGRRATCPCPIPGCPKVFFDTRGGWDAHVSSLRKHSDWHPEATDPAKRKLLFRMTFPDWFR